MVLPQHPYVLSLPFVYIKTLSQGIHLIREENVEAKESN